MKKLLNSLFLLLFLFPTFICSGQGFVKSGLSYLPKCDATASGDVPFYSVVLLRSKNPNKYDLIDLDVDGNLYTPSGAVSLGFCSSLSVPACPSDTIINEIVNNVNIWTDSSATNNVSSITFLSDTTMLSNPIVGDVLIVDSAACGKGLSFYNGDNWTAPLEIQEKEDHGRVLYVSVAGGDGMVGDEHCTYPSPQIARDSSVSSDVIHLYPGTYDLVSTGDYLADQLGKEGDTITYYLEPGATINNDVVDMGTGLGRWSNFLNTVPSRLDILGNGSLRHTTRLPGVVSTGLYGDIDSHIELERSVSGSSNWAVQNGSKYSSIRIKRITASAGSAYASTSASSQDYPYTHFFRGDNIEQVGTYASIRDQGRLDFRGSMNKVLVGNIGITGSSANAFFYQRDQGALGLTSSITIGNINNQGNTAGTYLPTQWDSNLAKPTELQLLGGNQSTFPNRSTRLFLTADNIHTTQQIASFQGQIFTDTSGVVISAPNAFTTDGAGFSFFGGSLKNHSHMVVDLNSTSGKGAAMFYHVNPMTNARNIDSTSSLTITGTYRVLEAGQPVMRINTANSIEQPGMDNVFFRRSHFFNDGVAPLVSGTTSQPVVLNFENAVANTQTFTDNPNIDWQGTLTLNDTLIHRRDVHLERKLVDALGSPGTAGQFLTSTDSTVVWSDGLDGSETAIQGGTNVTVTGTGTLADPYIVNSTDSVNVDNLYNKSDTLTDNRLLTGNGNTLEFNFDNGSTEFYNRWELDELERRISSGSVYTEVKHRSNFWQAYTENIPGTDFNVISNSDGYSNMKNVLAAEGGNSEVGVSANAVHINITGARDLLINNDPGHIGQVIKSNGVDKAPIWGQSNIFENRFSFSGSGNINNLSVPDTIHRVVLDINTIGSLSGVEAKPDGTVLQFHITGANCNVLHDSSLSTQGNQFYLPGGSSISFRDGGSFIAQYDGVLDYWYLLSANP